MRADLGQWRNPTRIRRLQLTLTGLRRLADDRHQYSAIAAAMAASPRRWLAARFATVHM